MADKRFTITITSTNTLSVSALWPDGDAPADPTAEDVLALIEECGGASSVLRDWDLDTKLRVDVTMVAALSVDKNAGRVDAGEGTT